jgi:hypothetical protein
MNKALIIASIALLARALSAAESSPQAQIASATKQLAEKPNYSWTTTMKEGDGSPSRIPSIDGKVNKDGLTYLSFEIGGIPIEVYMNGQKGAAKALEGWQTFDEVAQSSSTAAAVVRFLRSYKAPAAEAAALGGTLKNVKETEGAISGELPEDATKERLLFGARRREGQEPPKIENPKGSVKLWLTNGIPAKFETHIQGKVTAGEREMDVDRITTVEFKDAGTTKLELPAEAKEKLQ